MPLILVTDDRAADWVGAARALPAGTMIIVRSRDSRKRAQMAKDLHGLGRLLIADDHALAMRLGAQGLHLPQSRMSEAAHWRALRADWIITASAHSLRAVMGARGLDALLLAPIFPTQSHKLRKALTPLRGAFIAALAQVPVYALGGVSAANAILLPPSFSGIAGISAFL